MIFGTKQRKKRLINLIYAPLNSPKFSSTTRNQTPEPALRFDAYTHIYIYIHTQYAYTFTRLFAEKGSPTENSTEAATTVWIPVYIPCTQMRDSSRVGGTRQRRKV